MLLSIIYARFPLKLIKTFFFFQPLRALTFRELHSSNAQHWLTKSVRLKCFVSTQLHWESVSVSCVMQTERRRNASGRSFHNLQIFFSLEHIESSANCCWRCKSCETLANMRCWSKTLKHWRTFQQDRC